MRKILFFNTTKGTFFIVQTLDGLFRPMFNNETYGGYSTIQKAVDDISGGHTFSVSGIDDTSTIGLPSNASDWEVVEK